MHKLSKKDWNNKTIYENFNYIIAFQLVHM